jgi:hypothetical protein
LNNANGTYIFIETSSPRLPSKSMVFFRGFISRLCFIKIHHLDQKARIISETFKPDSTNALCFTFWYHALGTTVGALRVFKADENVTNLVQLWEIVGQQSVNDKDWKKGKTSIYKL